MDILSLQALEMLATTTYTTRCAVNVGVLVSGMQRLYVGYPVANGGNHRPGGLGTGNTKRWMMTDKPATDEQIEMLAAPIGLALECEPSTLQEETAKQWAQIASALIARVEQEQRRGEDLATAYFAACATSWERLATIEQLKRIAEENEQHAQTRVATIERLNKEAVGMMKQIEEVTPALGLARVEIERLDNGWQQEQRITRRLRTALEDTDGILVAAQNTSLNQDGMVTEQKKANRAALKGDE